MSRNLIVSILAISFIALLSSSSLAVNDVFASKIIPQMDKQQDEINGPGGLMSSSGLPVQVTNDSNPLQIKAHHPAHVKKFIGPSASLSGGDTPVTIWTAYSFNKLGCTHTTTTDWTDPNLCGHGQTVAIVDAYDDPNVSSDLQTFDVQFGLPSCAATNGCFVKAIPQGTPLTDSGWALEISLDVQWAHSIAPGAKIVLVESSDNSYGSLLGAVDTAVGTGAQQVSNSWGGSEFLTESRYDYHFSSKTASFFVSSGDGGHGVLWPAASPYVISVGGTTLVNDSSGNWVSETAWSGSGGGISAYEPKPSYQNNFNTNAKRTVPDVSYDADPKTGVYVYDSVPINGQSGWWVVGGTSAGAPQWTGISAIANSQNAKLASASFGTSNVLYGAASGAESNPQTNPYLTNYHDVTSGGNGNCGSICNAGSGYDKVTGVGTPQANNLIPHITPTSLSVSINAPSTGIIGNPINLSSAPAGGFPAYTYAWTMTVPAGSHGTLSSTTVSNPAFTPDVAGSYVLELRVTDSAGNYANAPPATVTAFRSTVTTVTPNPSSVVHGIKITFNARVSDTSAGAKNTPTGTISWSDGGTGGSFSGGGTCILTKASSSVGTCPITYTAPTSTGSATITGTYSGDSTHKIGIGTSTLTVN